MEITLKTLIKENFKSKLISILIRTKNEDLYLEEVLFSVRKQKNINFEIVIVDSGSTDNTLMIAKQFNCKIFNMIPEEFTFGRSLNYGIEKCNGDIIVILSGHCTPINNYWLYDLVNPIIHGNFSATFGRQVAREGAHFFEKNSYLKCYPSEKRLDLENFSNANSALRKKCWELSKFDPNVSGSEDFLWAKNLKNYGEKYCYVNTSVVYHSHNENFKSVFNRIIREHIPLIKKKYTKIHYPQIIKLIIKSLFLFIFVIIFKKNKLQNLYGFYNFEIAKICALIYLTYSKKRI